MGLASALGDARHEEDSDPDIAFSPLSTVFFSCPASKGTSSGPFTAQQADAGRAAYQANCAGCHAADLSGIGNALPLAGLPFTGSWGNRTVGDLVGFMEGAMPPNNPGALGEANYLEYHRVYSAIERRAGRESGAGRELDRRHSQRRRARSWLKFKAVKGNRASKVSRRRGGRGAAAPAPRGLTIPGTVKNYTPITDAMMRNPDPADWLMIRHDYHANNFSTLNQITANNVQDLRLVWTWAMNEGTNQPAPVVHNGTMFINNPGNIVQALDAKTGELIWENRIGETATGNSQRGLAIYDDKVYVTPASAVIYALDARTGKEVWQTTDRRPHQRHLQHQQRAHHREGQGAPRPGRRIVRSVSRREVLHQRLRRARPES